MSFYLQQQEYNSIFYRSATCALVCVVFESHAICFSCVHRPPLCFTGHFMCVCFHSYLCSRILMTSSFLNICPQPPHLHPLLSSRCVKQNPSSGLSQYTSQSENKHQTESQFVSIRNLYLAHHDNSLFKLSSFPPATGYRRCLGLPLNTVCHG